MQEEFLSKYQYARLSNLVLIMTDSSMLIVNHFRKGRGSIRPKNGPYGKHISVHSRSCSTIRDSNWQQKKPHIQCIRRRESSNILSSKIIEKSSIASTSDSQGGMPQASTRLKTIQSGVVLHEEQESPYEGVFENHVPGVKKCIYYWKTMKI